MCVCQIVAMDLGEPSPLRHFVVAKRTINAVFDLLLEYVKEGSEFVEGKKIHESCL